MSHIHRSTSDDGTDAFSAASRRASNRSQRARIAALKRWGHANGTDGTSAARSQFLSRFEREADPDGTLPEEERAIRAARLKSAHFRELALRSTQARRTKSKKFRSNAQPESTRSTPSLLRGEDHP